MASFVGRTDAKTSGRTRKLVLLGLAASGSRHMGVTIGAYAPGQAMRRRMPAEEVKKDLKQDDYFNGRLAHVTSQIKPYL